MDCEPACSAGPTCTTSGFGFYQCLVGIDGLISTTAIGSQFKTRNWHRGAARWLARAAQARARAAWSQKLKNSSVLQRLEKRQSQVKSTELHEIDEGRLQATHRLLYQLPPY